MYKVVKAGRLANGAERGKGRIVHWSESDYLGRALCGAQPRIQWSVQESDKEVTCVKCKKLKGGTHE